MSWSSRPATGPKEALQQHRQLVEHWFAGLPTASAAVAYLCFRNTRIGWLGTGAGVVVLFAARTAHARYRNAALAEAHERALGVRLRNQLNQPTSTFHDPSCEREEQPPPWNH